MHIENNVYIFVIPSHSLLQKSGHMVTDNFTETGMLILGEVVG